MIKWNDINKVEPELCRNVLVKFNESDMLPYYVLYKDTNGEYTEASGEQYLQWRKEEISHWIYLEDLEN